MREIKFRAWDRRTQKMFNIAHSWFEDWYVPNDYDFANVSLEIMDAELMQYTGFINDNNDPLWEGDIVVWGDNVETIYYDDDECSFRTETSMLDGCMEVIGNIYENKHLS